MSLKLVFILFISIIMARRSGEEYGPKRMLRSGRSSGGSKSSSSRSSYYKPSYYNPPTSYYIAPAKSVSVYTVNGSPTKVTS